MYEIEYKSNSRCSFPSKKGYVYFKTFDEAQEYAKSINGHVCAFRKRDGGSWTYMGQEYEPFNYYEMLCENDSCITYVKGQEEDIRETFDLHIDALQQEKKELIESGFCDTDEEVASIVEKIKRLTMRRCYLVEKVKNLDDDSFMFFDNGIDGADYVSPKKITAFHEDVYSWAIGVAI